MKKRTLDVLMTNTIASGNLELEKVKALGSSDAVVAKLNEGTVPYSLGTHSCWDVPGSDRTEGKADNSCLRGLNGKGAEKREDLVEEKRQGRIPIAKSDDMRWVSGSDTGRRVRETYERGKVGMPER